jgi:hypothetical protein
MRNWLLRLRRVWAQSPSAQIVKANRGSIAAGGGIHHSQIHFGLNEQATANLLECILDERLTAPFPIQTLSAARISGVPPVNRNFTGREDVLERILSIFSRSQISTETRLVAVTGLGGIGKSSIAAEYCWRHQDEYVGIWWVNSAQRQSLLSGLADHGKATQGGFFSKLGLEGAAQSSTADTAGGNLILSAGISTGWLIRYSSARWPSAGVFSASNIQRQIARVAILPGLSYSLGQTSRRRSLLRRPLLPPTTKYLGQATHGPKTPHGSRLMHSLPSVAPMPLLRYARATVCSVTRIAGRHGALQHGGQARRAGTERRGDRRL